MDTNGLLDMNELLDAATNAVDQFANERAQALALIAQATATVSIVARLDAIIMALDALNSTLYNVGQEIAAGNPN